LNGGYIIDDTNPRNELYYNIYPATIEEKIIYMSSETSQPVQSTSIIKLSDQKKAKDILENYLQVGRTYKFEFVSKLIKKFRGRGILENKFDTVIGF